MYCGHMLAVGMSSCLGASKLCWTLDLASAACSLVAWQRCACGQSVSMHSTTPPFQTAYCMVAVAEPHGAHHLRPSMVKQQLGEGLQMSVLGWDFLTLHTRCCGANSARCRILSILILRQIPAAQTEHVKLSHLVQAALSIPRGSPHQHSSPALQLENPQDTLGAPRKPHRPPCR